MPRQVNKRRFTSLQWTAAILLIIALIITGLMRLTKSASEALPTPRADTPPIYIDDSLAMLQAGAAAGRHAELVGAFQASCIVLLEGRQMYGQKGYLVATPMVLRHGQGKRLLVLQGWLPADTKDPLALARRYTPEHELIVYGRLERLPELDGAQALDAMRRTHPSCVDGAQAGSWLEVGLRQMYYADSSEKDVRNNVFKRHWPDMYSAATYLRQAYFCLGVAAGLSIVFAGLWWQQRARKAPSISAPSPPREKARIRPWHIAALLAAVTSLGFRFVYIPNAFAKVRNIAAEDVRSPQGRYTGVTLKNPHGSTLTFDLRCSISGDADFMPNLSETVTLRPHESKTIDFLTIVRGLDVGPTGRSAHVIPLQHCIAVWKGPFGIRQRAWYLDWRYSKPAYLIPIDEGFYFGDKAPGQPQGR